MKQISRQLLSNEHMKQIRLENFKLLYKKELVKEEKIYKIE